MKLDASKFKKVASDDNMTILRHEDGHEIKIAHSKLKPFLKKQLDKIPHYADGGEHDQNATDPMQTIQNAQPQQNMSVDPSQAPWASNVAPVPETAKAPAPYAATDQMQMYNRAIDSKYTGLNPIDYPPEKIQAMKFGPNGEEPASPDYSVMQNVNGGIAKQAESEKNKADWEALERDKINQQRAAFGLKPVPGPSFQGNDQAKPISAETEPQEGQSQQSPSQPNVIQATDASQYQLGALQMGQQGIDKQAQAEAELGRQKAALDQQRVQDLTKLDTNFKSGQQKKMIEMNNLIGEINNQKIDPKHYMENMSVGGKIANAIGLILGGMGGGILHQENPALKYLNAQIDRDVDAQRMNLNSKQNLVNHYSQELQNERAGYEFAKATQYAIYASKVDEAANKMVDPIAQARAQQLKANLLQQAVPYLQRSQAYDMLYGKSSANLAPEQKLLLMKNTGMINESQYAEGNKEAGRLRERAQAQQNLLSAFDKLTKQNTIVNRTSHAGFQPASMAEYESQIMPLIKDQEGRVTPAELDIVKNLAPQPGDTDAKINQKRQGLQNFIRAKNSAPTLTGLNIKVPGLEQVNFKPAGR